MNFRILSTLLCIALFFASCSTEEATHDNLETSDSIYTESGPSGPSYDSMSACVCNLTYNFPVRNPGPYYQQVNVVFDSSLSLGEIHCLKYEYFECLHKGSVFVSSMQPDMDPYTETWLWDSGRPLGDLISDICEDPMTSSPACGD